MPRYAPPTPSKTAILSALEYQLPRHFLHPGEIFYSNEPHVVTTVLGSCVAVCLYDPMTGVGGMNHFVLPVAQPNTEPTLRHGEHAIQTLIGRLTALGARPRTLRAKVFGGGTVLGREANAPLGPLDIGRRNVAVCHEVLTRHRIPIVNERVNQTSGMTIKMVTSTGEVWVRRVARAPSTNRQDLDTELSPASSRWPA